MNPRRNVLMTSGGKGVGIVRQLREAMNRHPALANGQFIVASSEAFTPAGCFADGFVQVPPSREPAFVKNLREVCRQQRIGIVVPLSDADLNALAPHRQQFADQGTTLICPQPALVELCADKLKFAQFATAHGMHHPSTHVFPDLDGLSFPAFYKRRFGSGSVGSGVCASRAEAARLAAAASDLLFQELVEAPEITVDAYISQAGACLACVQRVRDKVVGGQAYRSHTVNVPAVGDLALRVISALTREGLRGPLNVQIFQKATPVLLEVNPRLGSAVVLSNLACGGRLLDALLTEALGGTCTGGPFDYRLGLQLNRFLGDVFHEGTQVVAIQP